MLRENICRLHEQAIRLGTQTAYSIPRADGIYVCSTSVMLVAGKNRLYVGSIGEDVMELAVLIVGLLLAGSQIPGNSHIMLR